MNAFSSIGWIAMLLCLFFYISSILGIMAFGSNDPWHFENLHLAMMTLFRAATLEDWTDIMYLQQKGCDGAEAFPYMEVLHRHMCDAPEKHGMWAFGFFFIFIMVGNYVLLSLFIGIIAAEMEGAMRAQATGKQLMFEVRHYCHKNKIKPSRGRLFEQAYWLVNEIRPSEGIDFEVMKICLELIGETAPEEVMFKWFRQCADRPPGGELNIFDFTVFLTNMPWRNDEKMDITNDAGSAEAADKAAEKAGEEKRHRPSLAAKMAQGSGPVAAVGEFGEWNRKITTSDWYSNFMLSVVVFAGVLVGMQVGYGMEDNPVINALDMVVLVIFTVEILQKILSYPFTPWTFFVSQDFAWNWFDFVIVVLSFPGVFSAAGALRLLRLARLIKIVNKVPKIKVIVTGLIAGLNSVVYIMLLMFIVFYIYAVVGVSVFSKNDPFHFPNIATAFQTLFRVATLEDWTDVWYINYYGCDYFTAIGAAYYTSNGTKAERSMPANLLPGTPGDMWSTGVGVGKTNWIYCEPSSSPGLATFFFISFVSIASFVLLSLFVGAILISTMDAVEGISEEVKELKAKKKSEAKEEALHNSGTLKMRGRRQQIGRSILSAWKDSKKPDVRKFAKKQLDAITKYAKTKSPDEVIDLQANLDWDEAAKFSPAGRLYFILAYKCRALKQHKLFSLVINLCIMVASILVGVSASKTASLKPGEALTDFPVYRELETVDYVLSAIVTVEVRIGISAEGFTPLAFFKDGWNRLDFVIVASSYVPGIQSLALLMRMIRLLRVLKVLRVFPELRMLVMALMQAKDSIMFVVLLMFLVFYVFAIFSIMLFKKNDPWHFKNLHTALMTLFRVATGEDWTDIMYTAQMGCEVYPATTQVLLACECTQTGANDYDCTSNEPHGWWAVLFFVVFHMIGGLVFLNLFVGVITVGMADAMEFRDEEQHMDRRVAKLKKEAKLSDAQVRTRTHTRTHTHNHTHTHTHFHTHAYIHTQTQAHTSTRHTRALK
jgi:voltage-gated sodium channel